MGVLHIFNGISEKSKQTFNFNGKLKNFFLDNKQIDFSHSVILKDGYQIDGDYEVTENDIIYLRKTPSAGTTAGIVAVVALVVAVTAGAVAVGVSIYQNRKAQEELEKAEKASKAAQEQSNKLPFIKGARNQAATAQSFPFAIGKSLMTPYRLCPAHYTIAGDHGEQQYYNAVLEIAYNNIVINKVKMGETVIKDFGDTTTPQNGQFAFDAGTYYDSRNLIEIRNTGAFIDDAFNKKIVMQELGNEIPHDLGDNEKWRTGLVQDLASNPMKAELIILFDGLQQYKDDMWQPWAVTLSPQWTNVNNPTESDWIDFDNGFKIGNTYSNTFWGNTREQMRFVATQEFTPAQAYGKNIKVRIRRLTMKADSNTKENVYLLAVQTHCYDAKKSSSSNLVAADVLEPNERDKCCRIGVRIAANANTDGQLDAISVIETACARTWNGSEWSNAKTPTRNLAAWALELLTSAHHKPSQYEDEEIDLDSFGEWYEYCEQEHFYADGVITRATKKETILNTLCQNSNATLVKNPFTGLIECYLDNGREYSIAHLNSENIISISTAKELKRKTDGKKVKYINGAEDYAVDTVTFMRDGGDYDPQSDTLTELSLEYVTSYEHAFKIAWRKMAEEIAQPRVITVKVGYEAAYYPLYSRIDLQHKSLSNGLAHGVIKSLVYELGILKKIILEGVVTFPQDVACGVIINCVSDTEHGVLCLKVSGSGKTSELTVESYGGSLAVTPAVGNILSFGELDDDGDFTLVASPMKITNAEENDNGFTLTLVDYNADLYTYGTLPAYKSNITYKPDDASITIEEQRPVMQTSDAEALVSGAAQAACDEIIKGTHFNSVYKITPSPLSLEEIIAKLDNDTQNASASISMSHDEILLQVENTEKGLRGLIDIQAGSVQALVEGGGASGQMALSINLPAVINADTRTRLINASSLEKVNAVYALIEGTANYGIKGNVTDAQLKALWSDACDAGLLASQIELQADKIYIGGDVIVNTANKIKASMLEVEEILTKNITMKEKGVIKSSNYNGTINENGEITKYGDSGFALDHNGKSDFVNINATGGSFKDVIVDGDILNGTLEAHQLKKITYSGEIVNCPFFEYSTEYTEQLDPDGNPAQMALGHIVYLDEIGQFKSFGFIGIYDYPELEDYEPKIWQDLETSDETHPPLMTKNAIISLIGYKEPSAPCLKIKGIMDENYKWGQLGEIYHDANGFLKIVLD